MPNTIKKGDIVQVRGGTFMIGASGEAAEDDFNGKVKINFEGYSAPVLIQTQRLAIIQPAGEMTAPERGRRSSTENERARKIVSTELSGRAISSERGNLTRREVRRFLREPETKVTNKGKAPVVLSVEEERRVSKIRHVMAKGKLAKQRLQRIYTEFATLYDLEPAKLLAQHVANSAKSLTDMSAMVELIKKTQGVEQLDEVHPYGLRKRTKKLFTERKKRSFWF